MTLLFAQIAKPFSIAARDVAMVRGEALLFSGLSATINSGDILWIQGDNGIGKTTLLGAMAGLSRVDKGKITWQRYGQSVVSSQLVAYQPHKGYAKSTMTAREDIAFWAKIHSAEKLHDAAFDYVGLAGKIAVPTQNLSAGQKRRLALAKLIISQKPVWIMDEPSAAIDIDGEDLIDRLVSAHIARGGAAIIASHGDAKSLSAHTRKLTLRAAA